MKSSGTNARLIEYLIKDAQLIEDLTTTHDKQIQTIRSFQSEYSSDAWRVTYEEPLEDVRQRLSDVQIDVDIFDRKARDEIKVLNDISRNIIQLVSAKLIFLKIFLIFTIGIQFDSNQRSSKVNINK